MAQTVPDCRRAYYEFRWFAAVGMIAFLIAAACGSFVVMAAGMMMWGGFGMLARSFAPGRAVHQAASGPVAQVPHPQRAPDGHPAWHRERLLVETYGGKPPTSGRG